jgi:hypothetical protein
VDVNLFFDHLDKPPAVSETRNAAGQLQQAGVNDLSEAPPGSQRWVSESFKGFTHWPNPSTKFVIHYEACDCNVCELMKESASTKGECP